MTSDGCSVTKDITIELGDAQFVCSVLLRVVLATSFAMHMKSALVSSSLTTMKSGEERNREESSSEELKA